jgi:hypothetical protein
MSLLSAALVASCGGDKAKVATPSTTTPVIETTTSAETTTAAPVTTTAAPVAVAGGDQSAKAKAATLQPSDFPTGFDPVPEAEGGGLNIEQLWTELMGCLGVPQGTSTGIATSPTFKRGLATQARSTVEYTSDSTSAAIAAAIAGPKFSKCSDTAFAADVKRSAPEGGVPGPVAVAASKAPPVAPKSSSFRITVTVNLAELKVPLFQDFFVIYTGGAVIRALFLNPGSEFPQDLERSVLTKVISRT